MMCHLNVDDGERHCLVSDADGSLSVCYFSFNLDDVGSVGISLLKISDGEKVDMLHFDGILPSSCLSMVPSMACSVYHVFL